MRTYTQTMVRLFAATLVIAGAIAAADKPVRVKASDYPVHGAVPEMEIGAEYLVHSVPADNGYYFADDYLVVDVGIFPSTQQGVRISAERFRLRINKGKSELAPSTPGTVAASLKYPDWERHPNTTAQAGPVILAPSQVERFPGDPRQTTPMPQPAPKQEDPSGGEQAVRHSMEEMIANAALPEGETDKPVRGCLFFHYRGKMKSIKSLELVYDAGDGGSIVAVPLF